MFVKTLQGDFLEEIEFIKAIYELKIKANYDENNLKTKMFRNEIKFHCF